MSSRTAPRPGVAWTFLVTGMASLAASFMLVVEYLRLLDDPDVVLSCDIGPFVACAPVMTSPAAALFGFPNPILGLVCFTVVITTGVVSLAGVRLPRWYWRAFAIGTVLAGVFITWLQYQSIFVIGSLCAWCMLVWAATIPLIVVTLGFTFGKKAIGGAALLPFGAFLLRYAVSIVVVWYLLVLAAITIAFYDDFALMLN